MKHHRHTFRHLVGIVAMSLLAQPVVAQDSNVYEDSSLSMVPADVAIYSASLRLEEQWNIFAKSNAAKKIMQNVVVGMGVQTAKQMWEGDDPQVQMVKELLADPPNQRLIGLLRDAFSQESFFYADEDVARLLALANRLNGTIQMIQLETVNSDDPEAAMANKFIELALEEADNIRIPDVVMGWKLKNNDAAKEQLDRLEAVLAAVIEQQAPILEGRLKREAVGGGDFLTLNLDGSLIPWDELDREDFPGDPEKLEKLIAKAKEMTLSIALGQRGNYLMFSIGDTAQHIAELGKGETLGDRAELQKMRRHVGERIVSIGYVSEAFMKQANNVGQQIEDAKSMIGSLIELSELPENVREKIVNDGGEILDDLKQVVPEVGAQFGYAYLVDNGIEGYSYSWGDSVMDDSGPLSLTSHVGGNPILAFASRTEESPEDYDMFVNVIKQIGELADEVVVGQLGDEERAQYKMVRDKVLPLLKRLDATTRDNLMPALASNESAVVFDAKVKSAQPQNMMPLSNDVLPIPEMAIVLKVDDAEKLKQGTSDYFAVAQEFIDMLHEMEPNQFPKFDIPGPEVNEEAWGDSFLYPLPIEAGIDDQIAPNAGLSKDLAVLSLAPQTTSRLMLQQPLDVADYRVDVTRPAGSVIYFNFNGLIDMLEPWINYGVDAGFDDAFMSGMVKSQVGEWTSILKCFKGSVAVSYKDEDGVSVTHSHSLFEDL
jgi:hypothetical protein